VALPVLWAGPYAIALAALLVGGTFMVITMTGMQEAREVGGQQAIGLMAAMTSAFAVGQIVGPASVSFLLSTGGNFSWALLAASFLLTASAGVLLLSPRRVQSA
ncbi:MAG TPA: YbfB/YjiJ family MFS transporter, partial [Pyrinomonadaceae bacterium]|nr:YbfB/YjiJ family MFS transporter [Pyrinomonadaceae bacterium]